VAGLVLAYYVLLRSIVRTRPELRRCRTRCRHCGIFFLTHPRNAGRCDLGCPFGCREEHRRRAAIQRSTAYYQDKEGKRRKAIQNGRRRQVPKQPAAKPAPSLPWPRPIVGYVRVVVGLIEGRTVTLEEVVEMLRQKMRQHSMGRRRRIDQAIARLNERPP
jgi:hypothetical protein